MLNKGTLKEEDMYKMKLLLVSIIIFIMAGYSEAENSYRIDKESNRIQPLSKDENENFENFLLL
jgi:hypothetical protein